VEEYLLETTKYISQSGVSVGVVGMIYTALAILLMRLFNGSLGTRP